MAQRGFERSVLEGEIALGVARPSSSTGVHALDLVYQAAGVFRSIEDRARETEARAEAAERGQRELIAITERKLSDASKALEEAQKRIEAQQDRLSAIEYRAQAAEADARNYGTLPSGHRFPPRGMVAAGSGLGFASVSGPRSL